MADLRVKRAAGRRSPAAAQRADDGAAPHEEVWLKAQLRKRGLKEAQLAALLPLLLGPRDVPATRAGRFAVVVRSLARFIGSALAVYGALIVTSFALEPLFGNDDESTSLGLATFVGVTVTVALLGAPLLDRMLATLRGGGLARGVAACVRYLAQSLFSALLVGSATGFLLVAGAEAFDVTFRMGRVPAMVVVGGILTLVTAWLVVWRLRLVRRHGLFDLRDAMAEEFAARRVALAMVNAAGATPEGPPPASAPTR
ncbi:MAG: hypothetical protein JNL90_14040 [Planctomycetes bacterium]|nr:hypothetical protein [Planctomycetota bacterium]